MTETQEILLLTLGEVSDLKDQVKWLHHFILKGVLVTGLLFIGITGIEVYVKYFV